MINSTLSTPAISDESHVLEPYARRGTPALATAAPASFTRRNTGLEPTFCTMTALQGNGSAIFDDATVTAWDIFFIEKKNKGYKWDVSSLLYSLFEKIKYFYSGCSSGSSLRKYFQSTWNIFPKFFHLLIVAIPFPRSFAISSRVRYPHSRLSISSLVISSGIGVVGTMRFLGSSSMMPSYLPSRISVILNHFRIPSMKRSMPPFTGPSE